MAAQGLLRAPDRAGGETQVGLLWAEDLAGLEALKRKLEEEGK